MSRASVSDGFGKRLSSHYAPYMGGNLLIVEAPLGGFLPIAAAAEHETRCPGCRRIRKAVQRGDHGTRNQCEGPGYRRREGRR